MLDNHLQFSGNVRVYLQGKEALEPIHSESQDHISYFVANPESEIVVHDFRQIPVEAAHRALAGYNASEFANTFNQPARVKICSSTHRTEIELHESSSNDNKPVLWLGVIDNGKMPAHPVEWEVLKPVSGNRVAFAALVP